MLICVLCFAQVPTIDSSSDTGMQPKELTGQITFENVHFSYPSRKEVKVRVSQFHICDMIKRNESDVRDIAFEILAKAMFKFFCFILFLALTNSSYLCYQISNVNGIALK